MSQYAGPRTREIVKPVVELLAGIPSVVLGFFALMVMATWFQNTFGLESRLNALVAGRRAVVRGHPGDLHAVGGGAARRAAQLRRGVDRARRRALADDRARVLPAASPGIAAGVALGLGRAVGETMIVLMASGNAAIVSASLTDSTRTIAATIAAELAEVVFGGAHYTVLFFLGTLLFLVTFGINTVGDWAIRRMKRKLGARRDATRRPPRRSSRGAGATGGAPHAHATCSPTARWRSLSGATLLDRAGDPGDHPVRRHPATGAAPVVDFLTEAPRDGMTAGGIFPAIFGMVEMVILMTLAGVPSASRPRSTCTSTRRPCRR